MAGRTFGRIGQNHGEAAERLKAFRALYAGIEPGRQGPPVMRPLDALGVIPQGGQAAVQALRAAWARGDCAPVVAEEGRVIEASHRFGSNAEPDGTSA